MRAERLEFVPITFTIETQEEFDALYRALSEISSADYEEWRMSRDIQDMMDDLRNKLGVVHSR